MIYFVQFKIKEVIIMAKPKKKYSDLSRIEKNLIKKKLGITKIQDIDIAILKKLKDKLKSIKDTRYKNKITYKLWDVIMCVVLASFAQNDTWEDIHEFVVDNYKWLRNFLQMTGGIPTEDSYERIIGLVDKDELNNLLFDFFDALTFAQNPETEMYNFDGRINNGSKQNLTIYNKAKSPLNCLNVYSNKYGYCIYTNEIEEKTNEIPKIEEIVQGLNLKGIIVTWDALNTQTKNIKAVIEAGGDYIVPIKGNQGNFHQDLIDYFDEEQCDKIIAGNSKSAYMEYTEKSHSAVIKYQLFQTSDIKWYSKLEDWEKVKSFSLVRKIITKKIQVKNTRKNAKKKIVEKEITTIENRYYISSKYVNVQEFNNATRGHWNIENKIHWHLDFTFAQDKNSTKNKKALLNLEIIHKFVLACLERVKGRYNKSLRLIRKHLSNNFEEFLPELVAYLLVN